MCSKLGKNKDKDDISQEIMFSTTLPVNYWFVSAICKDSELFETECTYYERKQSCARTDV